MSPSPSSAKSRQGMDRRSWLVSASAGAAVAAMGKVAHGIAPIQRSGAPRFAFSLAAYSYRTLLQGGPAKLSLFDFIDDCAGFGLQGTELTAYYFQQPTTPAYLRQLKHHCFHQGIDISGTAIRSDFGLAPGPQRDREIEDVKRWIERAEILGAPVIRIFAGHQPDGQSDQRTHARMVEGIQACCEFAGQHGIHLALENHGGPTSTAEGLLALVRDVESDWFGVNLDTGNFRADDVYTEIAAAAPFAINVQVKVVVKDADGQVKPTDFGRIASILRETHYRGYVVLEYEEDGDPRAESERYLDRLRDAFG